MSYDEPRFDTTLDLVRLFDVFVTLPLVLVHDETIRRTMYGRAGEFRFQNYGKAAGVEFRTLSSASINKETIEYIFQQLNDMIDFYNSKGLGDILQYQESIIHSINNGDVKLASELCNTLNIKKHERTVRSSV